MSQGANAGADIHGVAKSGCSCWNVQDNDAAAGHPRNGSVLQCFGCVDGATPNHNQRFAVTGQGQIRAWAGYTQGILLFIGTAHGSPPIL